MPTACSEGFGLQVEPPATEAGLLLRNSNEIGNPRFPLKGSFKGDIDIGIDIDVDGLLLRNSNEDTIIQKPHDLVYVPVMVT